MTSEAERVHRFPTRDDAKPCNRCGELIVWRHTRDRDRPIPLSWPPEQRAVIGRSGKVHIVPTFTRHASECRQGVR